MIFLSEAEVRDVAAKAIRQVHASVAPHAEATTTPGEAGSHEITIRSHGGGNE